MSSPSLPVETLDNIVDHLHDTRDALKSCCLVSKSWISRTRTHLFSHVTFDIPEKLRSWKTSFPDPSTSPAHYTRSLFIVLPQTITPADARQGGWIPSFSHVAYFSASDSGMGDADRSFILFHGFSPAIRSLQLTFTVVSLSRTLDLIVSFPLLEDFSVIALAIANDVVSDRSILPSKTPVFTGTLQLHSQTGMRHIASQLLSLPSGLHFRQLKLTWASGEDIPLTAALIERCHLALEHLDIGFGLISTSVQCLCPHQWLTSFVENPSFKSIDLSKVKNLKEVTFSCKLGLEWIVTTLQTITRNHKSFQRISLDTSSTLYYFIPANPSGNINDREWLELDRTLCQLLESHSIRLGVLRDAPMFHEEIEAENRARSSLASLLPLVTGRGIVDLIRLDSRR